MAVTVQTSINNSGVQVATWTGDAGAGIGPAVIFGKNSQKTVQRVSGAGTYTVEGSNNGSTWGALSTPIAVANDNNLRAIADNPQFIRVTTATAACTVVIVGNQ